MSVLTQDLSADPGASALRAGTATEVLVCTTCRAADDSREAVAAGQRLWAALQAAVGPETTALRLRGIACLNSCGRACTVAFQAAGKHSYCFGDLRPGADTVAQVLACAAQHQASAEGLLPRSERPALLRAGLLLRLPPLQAAEAEGQPPAPAAAS